MSELTNLTDRISHLRDRKSGSRILTSGHPPETPAEKPRKQRRPKKLRGERRMATDYFLIFAYGLLAISLACQMYLIVWMDL